MRLPAPLLRLKRDVHKNQFGHVCVLAGSKRMLGAAALTSFGAIRSGAGLVTVGIPESLNTVVQRKIADVIMTLPLRETKEQSLDYKAFTEIEASFDKFDVFAVGPGLSTNESTQRLILKIIARSPKPLVIDADALNALAGHLDVLRKTSVLKILTPHPGEMSRLINLSKKEIEKDRGKVTLAFAKEYECVVLLKGPRTVVAAKGKRIYVNKTGNAGMATAGSGDVLTGMISAFLGQGLSGFEAAKYGAYLHGRAGDLAAKAKTRLGMIALDIINYIPAAVKSLR